MPCKYNLECAQIATATVRTGYGTAGPGCCHQVRMIGLAFWAPHPALKAMPVDRARDSSGHRAAGPEEELQNKNGHPVGATRGSGFSVPPYGMRLDACRRRLTKRDARPAMLLARRWPQRCCWPGKRVLAASHAAMGRHRWSRWRRLDGRLWRRFAKISKNELRASAKPFRSPTLPLSYL